MDELVLILVGAVIGIVLTAGWDVLKTRKTAREELDRAARSVIQEIEFNLKIIDGDLNVLETDSQTKEDQEVVLSPNVMTTVAGDTAFLRGSFDVESVGLSERLRAVYTGAAVINRAIEHREFYRATNSAMTNYHKRRLLLNAGLKADLEDIRRRFDGLLVDIKNIR